MSEHDQPLEDRLRDAFTAYAETVEPDQDWAAVAGRLDRRGGIRRLVPTTPIAIGVAATVAVAVVAVVAVAALGLPGGDEGGSVYVGSGEDDDEDRILAVTVDDRLVEIVPGQEPAQIADLGEIDGASLMPSPGSAPPLGTTELAIAGDLSVSPDGSVAFVQRLAVSDDCTSAEQLGTAVYGIPLDGSLDGVPDLGDAVARAPSFSPDGRRVAYVTTESAEPCDRSFVIEIKDLETWEVVRRIALPAQLPPQDLVWVEEDRLAVVLPLGTDAPENPLGLTTVDPSIVSEVGSQPELVLPPNTRVAGAGGGELLVAGRTPESTPLAEGFEAEGRFQQDVLDVSVWRMLPDGTDPTRLFRLPVRPTAPLEPLAVNGSPDEVLVTAVDPDADALGPVLALHRWVSGNEPEVLSSTVVGAALAAGGSSPDLATTSVPSSPPRGS